MIKTLAAASTEPTSILDAGCSNTFRYSISETHSDKIMYH